MNYLNIKKNTSSNISNFILAFLYGVFVFFIVQIDLENESGDIGSLLTFFEEFSNLDYFTAHFSYAESVDYLFRYIVIFIHEKTKIEFLKLLSITGFILSSLVFFIFTIEVNQKNKSLHLYLLFFMIFLHQVFGTYGLLVLDQVLHLYYSLLH